MAQFRELFKERNFVFLWLGQIISQFGDRLNHMALIGFIYKKAPGSTLQLAKLLSFTIIPILLLSSIAGAYVDRWDRRRTMIICDILRGALVLLLAGYLIFLKALLPVYAVVFLVFAVSCFFIPAKLSIIPDIVPKDKLLIANSLSTTSGLVATFMGLCIGGLVVELIGPRGAFYADSVTYLLSGLMIAMMAVRVPRRVREVKWVLPFRDIGEGLKYIINHKEVRFVGYILFLLMSGAGAMYAVIIVFVQEVFHSVTRDLSLLGLFVGAGFLVGSLVYGRFGARASKDKVIFSCLALCGIFTALFAGGLKIVVNFYLAGFLVAGLGATVAPIVVSTNTLVHEVIPGEMRGRTFATLAVVMHLALLVFMFISAALAEHVHRAWILIAVGALFTFSGVLGLLLRRR